MSDLGDSIGLAMKLIVIGVIVVTVIVTAATTWLVMRVTATDEPVQEIAEPVK